MRQQCRIQERRADENPNSYRRRSGGAAVSRLCVGKTGHRVVAAIADAQLSGLARAQIREILGPGESLDEAANWPDEMRADPAAFWQKTASPWHYVTLDGITYDHAPPEGDALQALDQ